MKEISRNELNKGYTIIETMISISLFLIVIMIGITTLLNANSVHHKSKNLRAIVDNINFIMEDMSRNMRTGYNFRCYDGNPSWNDNTPPEGQDFNTPVSCLFGGVISFEEAHGSADSENPDNAIDQWVYKISAPANTPNEFDIWKSVDGGQNFVRLNADEVKIDGASGFSVLGAEGEGYGNTQQPLVIIKLGGEIQYRNLVSPFSVETAVSQRLIDIE